MRAVLHNGKRGAWCGYGYRHTSADRVFPDGEKRGFSTVPRRAASRTHTRSIYNTNFQDNTLFT